MDFLELAKERYSVRSYENRPVEEEKLLKILEAGQVAPTACNNQPQKVYVLQSREALQKVDGVTPMRFGAPVVLLIAYDKQESWKATPCGDPYDAGGMDASIVCTHMMLEAQDLGIGSLWVRYFNGKEMHEAFDLPENEVVMCMLCLGYASAGAKPTGNHTRNKPLSETVTYL